MEKEKIENMEKETIDKKNMMKVNLEKENMEMKMMEKERKKRKEKENVAKLEKLEKCCEMGPIPVISRLEEVVVSFIEHLSSDEYEEIMLFYNDLDVETKEEYLKYCIKDKGEGTPKEIACKILRMTRTKWMVRSCDTTIENDQVKEDMRDVLDVVVEEVGTKSEFMDGVMAMKEVEEKLQDTVMESTDTMETDGYWLSHYNL